MNRRLATAEDLAEFNAEYPSDPEAMARVRKQLAEHTPAKRRLPDGTVEKTREELEAEIARLNAELLSEEDRRCHNEMLADCLAAENARLQAQIDYVKYMCGELAESYRIYAAEADGSSPALGRFYSGMTTAYEDAAKMFEPEVNADDTQENNGG